MQVYFNKEGSVLDAMSFLFSILKGIFFRIKSIMPPSRDFLSTPIGFEQPDLR